MPHQCVKCGVLYDDAASEIIKGCKCGGRLFFYIKKEHMTDNELPFILTKHEKEQIEKDVYEIMGDDIDRETPVVLDLESIKIVKPGKYELDLVNLFKKKQPLIYKLSEGKYMIDLAESFKKLKPNNKKK